MRLSLFGRHPNRLRMRIRTLMLLMVIIAVAIEPHILWRKRQEYLLYRGLHADDEQFWRESGQRRVGLADGAHTIWENEQLLAQINALRRSDSKGADYWSGVEAQERRNAKLAQDLANYHGAMREKYEYAASHPWITVPPDSPEPPVPD